MKTRKLLLTLIILGIYGCSNSETSIITMDTHDDINVENFTESLNYTMNTDTQVNLPKMIEGGLDVAWFIVYTGQGDLIKKVIRQHVIMQSQNLMQ